MRENLLAIGVPPGEINCCDWSRQEGGPLDERVATAASCRNSNAEDTSRFDHVNKAKQHRILPVAAVAGAENAA